MKAMLYVLFITFFIGISACSDNSTAPDDTATASDYFPMSIGNYWIYEFTELDQNSEPLGDTFLDSTVIEGRKEFAGKNFYTFVTYRNGVPIDTNYFLTENFTVYMIANENNTTVPNLSDTTFNILQLYEADWFIFNTRVDSMYMEWNGEKHYLAGDFNFHGYRNYGDDTVYIYDKQYIAVSTKVVDDRRYQMRDSTGNIFLHNQQIYYYYSKNIGPVMIRKEPHYIIREDNVSIKFPFNGWRRQMIRHKLK